MKNNGHSLTRKKRERFLEHLAEHGSVALACREIGFSRSAVYQLRDKDAEFHKLWALAVDEYIDQLEREVDRRAVAGIDHPVIYEGEITTTYKEYSDTLLMFRLKALAPDKYRERQSINLADANGKPFEFNVVLDVKGNGHDADAGAGGLDLHLGSR